jgi:small subunit ribosomal protein S20
VFDDAAWVSLESRFGPDDRSRLAGHPEQISPFQKDICEFMANHFSAVKRARQTEKRTARNRTNKSRLRTTLRRFREALNSGNKETAAQLYRETVSALDKSVQKGVIHNNTASRYKSRLATRLNAIGSKTA